MPFELRPGGSYRMPLGFGEVSGARNVPPHVIPDHARFPVVTRFSIHFRTDAGLLERQLPPGLRLAGEPIATLYFATMKEIQWLAGRGYNVLSFSFPAIFDGKRDTVSGHYKSVLWESLADPVISGREDLGFSKLWADIPDPRILGRRHHYEAAWQGFRFVEATFDEGETSKTLPPVPGRAAVEGTINLKYMPRSGERGTADASYLTFWPQFEASGIERATIGTADFRFRRATWEDLPTMHHVINGLADLPVHEIVRADLVWARGQGDVANLRILA